MYCVYIQYIASFHWCNTNHCSVLISSLAYPFMADLRVVGTTIKVKGTATRPAQLVGDRQECLNCMATDFAVINRLSSAHRHA